MESVKIFENQKPLICAHCGKNLFDEPGLSIIVFAKNNADEYSDIYTCCKGECDKILRRTRIESAGLSENGWKDISEYMVPYTFLKNWMALMNNTYDGEKFTQPAYETFKDIILATAPYVMRPQTKAEEKTIELQRMIPDWV